FTNNSGFNAQARSNAVSMALMVRRLNSLMIIAPSQFSPKAICLISTALLTRAVARLKQILLEMLFAADSRRNDPCSRHALMNLEMLTRLPNLFSRFHRE
ncbi:hypothetical protein, partial [Bradyrhizobium sp. ORS 375]|uniref:hypothetical protein n=1 Tax=Bradyrhizobium sp. (strain ORS 375) TaxID=566679 RepID=UPI001AEBFB59